MPRPHFIASCVWLLLCLGSLADPPSEAPKARVIALLDPGCPIARYHTLALRQCHEAFSKQGVVFEAHLPNPLVTPKEASAFAKTFQLPFPVHADPSQKKAKALKATIVPEVFVFDADDQLVYRGRVDDTYAGIGKRRPKARVHDLKRTLRALLEGSPISTKRTTPVGCPITFQPSP